MAYTLAESAEQAFVNLLTPVVRTTLALPATAAVPCFMGKAQVGRPNPPSVTCAVLDIGPEDPKDSGNFWVVMEIYVLTEAVQEPGQITIGTTQSKNLISAVSTAIYDTNLETFLSATVPDFTVMPNSMMRPGQPKREYM
jgi:hypothetical protein